jgi:hypothetical protein
LLALNFFDDLVFRECHKFYLLEVKRNYL